MSVFSRKVQRDEKNNLVSVSYNEPRTLTAAAVRVNLKDKTQIESMKNRRAEDTWQSDAWEYYDLIGEVGFAANLIASVTSRVRLFPAFIEDEENEPVHLRGVDGLDPAVVKAASDALRLLATGNGGTSGLLRDAALNLFIAGDCYLIQQPRDIMKDTSETWQIRSVDEVIVTTKNRVSSVAIKPRRNAKPSEYIAIPDSSFAGRIWRMHPRFSDESDSSLKSLLDLMDELLLLNKTARKTLKSRLNAGLLYIPDEISNISQSDGDVDESTDTYAELSDDNSSSFEEELLVAMTTPISDEGAAASIVPLIIRGPGELGEKIRHIRMEQSFDPQHTDRADRVLDRILSGLDLPKDVVAGIGDAKYANAVAIEESLFKSHVEPLILLIVDALTVVFLRPVLRAMGYEDEVVERIIVWYDPSPITAKPSKAESANVGYDKKILSATAWRRANGFAESDAPSSIETGQRIASDRGLLSEPVTEALFRLMMPELMEKVRQQQVDLSPSGSQLEDVIQNNIPQDDEPIEVPPTELIEP